MNRADKSLAIRHTIAGYPIVALVMLQCAGHDVNSLIFQTRLLLDWKRKHKGCRYIMQDLGQILDEILDMIEKS